MMEIGINELDYEDDDIFESEQEQIEQDDEFFTEEYEEIEEQPATEEVDLITRMLNSKGISDSSKIKFENEDGNTEELDWNDLTIDEQFNILSHHDEPETGLDDSEIDLINEIRAARLTPNEYKAHLMRQGALQAVPKEQPSYIIDDLTDDELFMYDLQVRNEDITNEEAIDALEKAKTSESFYNKQVKGLRAEYKKLEDDRNNAQAMEIQRQQAAKFNQFQNSIRNSIQSFNSIGNLDIELDNDDMDEVAQFLLTTDGAGINHFSKVLNDPDWLVKMAWFALKGEDAINNITDYFTTEMKQREQASYRRGLEDATKKNPKSKVVYQPQKNNNKGSRELTIDDLD